MVPPGEAEDEPGVSVMDRSAGWAVTLLVAVSFAEFVLFAELTVTEPAIVLLPGVVMFTATTSVNVLVVLAPRFTESVHVTLPAVPTVGDVQLHPAGAVTD